MIAEDGSGASPHWLTGDQSPFLVVNSPPPAPVLSAPTEGLMMMTLPSSLSLTVEPVVDFDDDAIQADHCTGEDARKHELSLDHMPGKVNEHAKV